MNSTPPPDARVIANAILDLSERRGQTVSVMKLLKLLYFAYGWFLVSTDRQLFHSPIEAWKHGPVIRSVWDEFRQERDAISKRATILNLATGEREIAKANLGLAELQLLEQVIDSYAGYSAWGLSDLTHEVGSPWHDVWHSNDQSANLGFRITDRAIREHFVKSVGRAIPT